jgi:hypothetical protein
MTNAFEMVQSYALARKAAIVVDSLIPDASMLR